MSLDRENIRRIMIAVNKIDGACALMSKKIGIKENTLTLLYALDDGKPHSQKEICEEWFLPKTTLNTIVKECEEAGLLVLNSIDGREKKLCLTQQGQIYAARILPQVYDLESRACARTAISPELVDILCLLADNLKEETRNFTCGT